MGACALTSPVFHWKRSFRGYTSLLFAADRSGTYETTMFVAGGAWHLRIRFRDHRTKHESLLHTSEYPKASMCSAAAVRVLSEVIETREQGE